MAQPEYRLKTTRSRLDYELYQVALPKYDPQIVQNIHIELPPSLRIAPDTQIGRIFLKNQPIDEKTLPQGKALLLATNFSGKLQTMGEHFEHTEAGGKLLYHLNAPQKKGQLSILSFRQCDHRPRDETFLNSNFAGQSTTPRHSISDSVTLCDGCQTVLWKYYDREEIPITLGELCKVNSAGEIREMVEDFQWSIVLNQQFTPRTEIGRCQGQEMTLPYLAKATFLIDFTEHRKKLREDTVIMRIRRVICKHEKVMDDCCQFCLQQVKKEHLSQFTNYLFQNQNKPSSVLVTGSALRQHEEMYIDGLLSSNKAMIILDLDNTILHSCQISDLDIKTVLSLKDFYLIPKIDCPFQQEEKGKRDLIVVKMRPYFRHFLYVITKLYQVYVYTKGTRVYAQQICKYIRSQYAGEERTHPYLTWQAERLHFLQGKKSFATNIISRDQDSNLDSKSFDRILPSKTEYHLILDDRRDVWNNSPAWFFTREYYYFLSKGKKTPEGTPPESTDDIGYYLGSAAEIPMAEMKGSLIEEYKMIKTQYPQKKDALMEVNTRKDYFLLFAAYALRKIHKNFFEALEQEKQEEKEKEKEKEKQGNMMHQKQGNSLPKRKFNRINLAYQYNRTKHFFKSLKIQCFLGEGQDENNNNTIRRAKKMGAIITDDSPHFIIRANDLMKQTKKPQIIQAPQEAVSVPTPAIEVPAGEYYAKEKAELKELFDKKIPVVSQSWIHYCYEFHYPFSFKEFILSDPYQLEVNHQDFSPYIDKEAKLILDKIEDEMARDINGDHKKQPQIIHPQPIRHKKEKKEHDKHHQKSII